MTGSLTFLDMAQMTLPADAPAVRRRFRHASIHRVVRQATQVTGQAAYRTAPRPVRQVMPRVGDVLTQRRVVDLGRTGSSVCRSH
jgi:hypothetical protein